MCGQNLLMLLNNVLDLARIENDKTEIEYSVSDIEKDFRNCLAMFRNQADSKGQTLTVTTQLPYPYIYADIPHLTEVCTNLVSNAVKYTGAGGHDPLWRYAEARRKRGLVRYGGHGCRQRHRYVAGVPEAYL